MAALIVEGDRLEGGSWMSPAARFLDGGSGEIRNLMVSGGHLGLGEVFGVSRSH